MIWTDAVSLIVGAFAMGVAFGVMVNLSRGGRA